MREGSAVLIKGNSLVSLNSGTRSSALEASLVSQSATPHFIDAIFLEGKLVG